MSRRIVVMGCAGAGKSVLARRLVAHWRLTYIARDDLAGPGQNTPEFRAAARRATATEGWVFDGTPFAVALRHPRETRRWLRGSGGRIRQSARRLRPGG